MITTKEMLLEMLERNRGDYFSGEEIAHRLSVSRAAVWKAVKALQKDGYMIHAVSGKGYSLYAQTDIISVQGIEKYLDCTVMGREISVLSSADSTNTLVREQANLGAAEGLVIIANQQTAGRGQKGRSFFSPKDTGIYMSVLLRPNAYSGQQTAQMTAIAAVAVCEAIEDVTGESAQIKWVNDIFMRGKKVCGILTEAAFSMESGLIEYAVMGIGINVYEPDGGFPKDVASVAGAVLLARQSDVKNRLISALLNRFEQYYLNSRTNDYVQQYRRRSLVIGKPITLVLPQRVERALVLGIDDECRLLVEYEDGTQAYHVSGELCLDVDMEAMGEV